MMCVMGTEPAGGPRFYGRETTPTETGPAAAPRPPVPPLPPLQPWAAPTPPAPPRPPQGRQFLSFMVVVVLLVSIAGSAFWFTTRRHGPSYPKHWDARVAPFVSFIERTRGLTFEHAVSVKFLSEAEFKKTVTTSDESLTKEDRADIRNSEAFLRALGLINGDTDLLAAVNKSQSEGVLAYYSPETKSITVRGTKLDVATRVTLVHEMTHALQDQHFDLTSLDRLDHNDESGAISALVEGDATEVENAYIDSLSKVDHAAYDRENAKSIDDADFDGVPSVVQIMFGAPYEFGPTLVQAIKADGGNAALDEAFRHPPTDEENIFDPTTYLEHDKPEHVTKPALPAGAKSHDSGAFEPLGWYVTLSERIDAHEALRAADGWGGDSYVTYTTRAGQDCTRVRYRGEQTSDTIEMQQALTDWVAALPAPTASVRNEGTTLLFESCDPGKHVKVTTGKSLDAIGLPLARVGILKELLHEGASIEMSSCVANGVVDQSTLAQVNDPDGAYFSSPEGQGRIVQIATACRQRTG
jgi:hypothetical protein